VPIDLDKERPITLSAAADLLSEILGVRIGYKTAYTWTRYGLKKVKLESVHIGASLFTTRQAVVRFVWAVLEADPNGHDWFRLEGVHSRACVVSALAAVVGESVS
jgi:hypothetical protein